MGRFFLEYGIPLTAVSLFMFLGGTLSSSDNDWSEVELSLWRVQ